MTNILHIQSSSNLNTSFSRQVGNLVVEALKKKHQHAQVTHRDIAKEPIPHLNPDWITAAFTAPDSPVMDLSKKLIDEVFANDILVIESPMYNFGIPSQLKSWIDYISRAGMTFKYTEHGPQGLVKGKKAILILSSGGIYSSGPMKNYEHQESYLRAVLSFLGITDIEVVRTEGVAMGADKAAQALEKAKEEIEKLSVAKAA